MAISVIAMTGVLERRCCSKAVYSAPYNLPTFGCVCVLKWKTRASTGMGMNLAAMGGTLELGSWMWSLRFIPRFTCSALWKSTSGVPLLV